MVSMLREGAISPVELVEAHLRQIERLNPSLNAFAAVLAESALVEARAREHARLGGEAMGLLDGVPVTIKDSFDVAGLPTLAGSRLRSGNRAAEDATVVARLRREGAILLGKTNTPELLASYETDNFITGRTNNPWDVERTPGGSSGGEAAAIAAFCSAGGVGERWRRVDPRAGALLRNRGAEAHAGPRSGDRTLSVDGLSRRAGRGCRPHGANGRGPAAAVRGAGGV